MTYDIHAPWITHSELIEKSLGNRIKYVRENLVGARGAMTQAEFASAIGSPSGHHAVVQWEKHDREPRDYAEAIAGLTPYPREAFLRSPADGKELARVAARLEEFATVAEQGREGVSRSLEGILQTLGRIEARLSAGDGPVQEAGS